MNLPRSGTNAGALIRQLSALERRRRLTHQQQLLQAGVTSALLVAPPALARQRPPA